MVVVTLFSLYCVIRPSGTAQAQAYSISVASVGGTHTLIQPVVYILPPFRHATLVIRAIAMPTEPIAPTRRLFPPQPWQALYYEGSHDVIPVASSQSAHRTMQHVECQC